MSYLPPILRAVKSLGHKVFVGEYDLNIVGVRMDASLEDPNHYSDSMWVVYQRDGCWELFWAPMSTTPGTYYLQHPMRDSLGCAVMAPGQYRGAYRIGNHFSHPGLLQREAPVRWFRDNDRSETIELDPGTITEGFAGLNIHRGSRHARSDTEVDDDSRGYVNKFSAGCQVLAPPDMERVLHLCRKQISTHPNWAEKFSYTLITAGDLR